MDVRIDVPASPAAPADTPEASPDAYGASLGAHGATPDTHDGSTDAQDVSADTLRTYVFERFLVSAPRPALIAEPGRTEIPAAVLEARDAGWGEALGAVTPAARVGMNSRGESTIQIRGAAERQIPLYLDGIPLAVPWDERSDIASIPTGAIGKVVVLRGAGSLLDGPNNLGGAVHLESRDLSEDGSRTTAVLRAAAGRSTSGSLVHLTRRSSWIALGAVERRSRDAYPLPQELPAVHNQPRGEGRLNSDLRQTALLLRGGRDLPRGGSIALFVSGQDAERGVPPETHLAHDQKPRYWRIPVWRRALVAGNAVVYPEETRVARLEASLSFDRIRQVVQSYADSTYTGTPEVLAAAREDARDKTWSSRLLASRRWSGESIVTVALNVRRTNHAQLPPPGSEVPALSYAQVLAGSVLEWEGPLAPAWSARAGIGYDRSWMPGNDIGRDPDGAGNATFRLTREIGPTAQVHVATGRRTRFPALRELYTDGRRFLDSPNLRPESQDSAELGAGMRAGRLDLAGSLFASLLRDGIERTTVIVDDRPWYQRVNRGRIRTFGAELSGQYRPAGWLRLDVHQAWMEAKAKDADGRYDLRTERRPEWLGFAAVTWILPRAARASLEATGTGASWGLDARLPDGGMSRVAASATWNARLSGIRSLSSAHARSIEVSARVNNLFDRVVYGQLGLPEPGRETQAGLRLEF